MGADISKLSENVKPGPRVLRVVSAVRLMVLRGLTNPIPLLGAAIVPARLIVVGEKAVKPSAKEN